MCVCVWLYMWKTTTTTQSFLIFNTILNGDIFQSITVLKCEQFIQPPNKICCKIWNVVETSKMYKRDESAVWEKVFVWNFYDGCDSKYATSWNYSLILLFAIEDLIFWILLLLFFCLLHIKVNFNQEHFWHFC